MNGWKQWSEQVSTSSFLEKKAAESLAREGLEGFQALGTDEVTSSNLVSSSIEYHPFFEFIERRVVAFDRAAASNQAAGRAK